MVICLCGQDCTKAYDTGVLVKVTLADGDGDDPPSGHLDLLEFRVAVSSQGPEGPYVPDPRAAGIQADVSGRDLEDDPFRLLVLEDGDGVMETLQVEVLAYKDGELIAWGSLVEPSYQTFLKGEVVSRTVTLVSLSCGNGAREGIEECDGDDLGATTCEDLGHEGGVLACMDDCLFDEIGCSSCEDPDEMAPVAGDHMPGPESQGAPADTLIEVHLFDACGVDVSSITMSLIVDPVSGAPVTYSVVPTIIGAGTDVLVTFIPPGPLDRGDIVEVTVQAADTSANILEESWRFSVRDTLVIWSDITSGIAEETPDDSTPPGLGCYEVGGGPGSEKRAIFHFVGMIPPGAPVFEATLLLGACTPLPAVDTLIECYRLNAAYSVNQSTWNERQPGDPWASPGANGVGEDREGVVGAGVLIPAGTPRDTVVEGDATMLATGWASGATNYGVICTSTAPAPVGVCSAWSNVVPQIVVAFGPPLP